MNKCLLFILLQGLPKIIFFTTYFFIIVSKNPSFIHCILDFPFELIIITITIIVYSQHLLFQQYSFSITIIINFSISNFIKIIFMPTINLFLSTDFTPPSPNLFYPFLLKINYFPSICLEH
jgi:hypothetical protein